MSKTTETMLTDCCSGYLARSKNGILIISPGVPERYCGYWVGERTKPYVHQDAFPFLTWESEPIKVKIQITIDHEEV